MTVLFMYPSKLIIYAFLVFISESMQTLFLFNMHRKAKWKMPNEGTCRFKIDLFHHFCYLSTTWFAKNVYTGL